MCGIIGMFAFDKGSTNKENKRRREAMLYLFTEVLQSTRTRGPDATGVSALFSDGDYMIQKGNIKSPEFIANFGGSDNEYDGFINNCRTHDSNLKMLVGHCRKSSVGNTWDNENNHPIKAGEIVGVHNGTLKNHEIVFNKLDCKRDGEVDSEAIMRLLQSLTNDCVDPFTTDTLVETFRRLEGAFTVMAYNANNPYQVALIRKERPMELAVIKPLKIVVVVSEKVFIEDALFNYNKQAMIYGADFDLIKEDDIDFLTMPLDNCGVLDLTLEIDADTKVVDLMDKVDACKEPKLWQVATKATTVYSQGTYNHTPHNAWQRQQDARDKKNSTQKNTGAQSSKTDYTFPGKVYCKELNAYVSPETAEELAKKGPVLLENPTGTITELGKEKEPEILVKKDKVNITVLDEGVEISEVLPISASVEVVEAEEDPEMLKAAQKEANGLTRYESDEEIVKALNAASLETLKALPTFALANRIKSNVYEQAFMDGANFYKECMTNLSATKAIRIAKHVVELFGNLIESLSDKKPNYRELLMLHVASMDTSELTKSNIKQVFSKGNFMKNKPLSTLEEVVKE
jgi:hypothetical protein